MGTGPIALRDELSELVAQPWLLLGVGNELRGDDAFGPLLARRLQQAGLPALDAGSAPENVTGPVRRSDARCLIVADAADIDEPPGTVRLLPAEALAWGGTSTHDPSLRLLIQFVTADRELDVRLLAAQPQGRELGAPPSPPMLEAVDRVAATFTAIARSTAHRAETRD